MLPIRVLLVDDHRIVCEGLRSMLSTQEDVEVVGEAGNGRDALESAKRLQPDIILLDLKIPDIDGIEILKQLRSCVTVARVIILTAYSTDDQILQAVRYGAKGYLLKGASLADVLHAVRAVAMGDSLFEHSIENRLIDAVGQMLRQEHLYEPLNNRERDILRFMSLGYGNRAIGQELHIAERTVKFYATIIFQKLQVSNRAEAVAAGFRNHLIAE